MLEERSTVTTSSPLSTTPATAAATAAGATDSGAVSSVQISRKAEAYYTASQVQLIFWRLRKHRLAMISLFVVVALYLTAIFSEFLSPYEYTARYARFLYAPPQGLHFIHEGTFRLRPFVYGYTMTRDPKTLLEMYEEDPTIPYYLTWLPEVAPYKMWGMIELRHRLFGVEGEGTVFLFGTDSLGRDLLSRILYGTRISLSIGLVGVILSLVLGILLGGISGFYGGVADVIIQRVIEILRAFPDIPLWMGIAAALPPNWPILRVYFAISIILALLGWTEVARVVRGKLLSLREQDFAMAARLAGVRERRIITHHLLPSFTSHLIVVITLSIPAMILGETVLSFLGLGLRHPVSSWGVLLQDAQNVRTIASYPWLLIPILFVVMTVLAFNFFGDGLRDAADPYSNS
ncbi:MAG: ABC transporter permease [Caldilineaceae bacterium]|nr:ABC transporter permease [Caldilineaceae bacterium]